MEHPLENIFNCPSCGASSNHLFLECTDHTYSGKSFSIKECDGCGLRFTSPRPSEADIGSYYENPDYVSHTDTSEGLFFQVYQLVKRFTLRSKLRLIKRYSNNGSLLDYGAGTGDFACIARLSGHTVSAFEPDSSARARIVAKDPQIQLVSQLQAVSDKSISVLTLWHVLEHIHRIDESLREFHRILEDKGTLIIAVPNCSSLDAQFYGRDWAAYDVPRHLYHFSPSTLIPLIQSHGFYLAETRPMWFDSFYVSLLSESNRNKTEGILNKMIGLARAASIGAVSNLNALFNYKKCSSVIYVFKRA